MRDMDNIKRFFHQKKGDAWFCNETLIHRNILDLKQLSLNLPICSLSNSNLHPKM